MLVLPMRVIRYCIMPDVYPHGVIRFFSAGDGGYTGLYTKIFIMHFNAENAFPGLYRTETEDSKKKLFFMVAKNGGYTPGCYTPGGVIHNALQ